MDNTLTLFEYEQYYHVFNRTNNQEILFRNNENRSYFLRLINKKLRGYVKIYAFALLNNHFHFAISIRSENEIIEHITNTPSGDRRKTDNNFLYTPSDDRDIHKLIATQWSRVFNSYSQAFNNRFERKGHLFHSPFKRSLIPHESRFSFLIYYIHHNSRKHGHFSNFLKDNWHSYHQLLANQDTFLERDFVIDWFGGREAFIKFHQSRYLEKDFVDIGIE